MTVEQAKGIAKTLSEELSGTALGIKAYFDTRLLDMEQRLTLKAGAMVIALAGFLVAIKLFSA